MKLNFKLLALIALITAPLLAMDRADSRFIRDTFKKDKSEWLMPLLISGKLSGKSKLDQKYPLIHVAALERAHKCVRALLEHGADVNVEFDRDTALCHAAFKHSQETIQILLEYGADIEKGSVSPLIRAIQNHTNKDQAAAIVQLLIDSGAKAEVSAEFSNERATALMLAAYLDQPKVIRILLLQDAQAPLIFNGKTALQIAQQKGHRECGVLLYQAEQYQKKTKLT